jgi:hypothetical protein
MEAPTIDEAHPGSIDETPIDETPIDEALPTPSTWLGEAMPAFGEIGQGTLEEMPVPQNHSFTGVLPKLTPRQRSEALDYFADFCVEWAKGFEEMGAPQPDRVELMQKLGSSRYIYVILIMAYEMESLQRLVMAAFETRGVILKDLDFVNRFSEVMVSVSHVGCPEIPGTFDYTTRWRRK